MGESWKVRLAEEAKLRDAGVIGDYTGSRINVSSSVVSVLIPVAPHPEGMDIYPTEAVKMGINTIASTAASGGGAWLQASIARIFPVHPGIRVLTFIRAATTDSVVDLNWHYPVCNSG